MIQKDYSDIRQSCISGFSFISSNQTHLNMPILLVPRVIHKVNAHKNGALRKNSQK